MMAREKKRKTKLLIEIATAVLPVYILTSVLLISLIYGSIIQSFKQSQGDSLFTYLDQVDKEIAYLRFKWLFDYMRDYPEVVVQPTSEEEENKMWDFIAERPSDDAM